MPLVETKQPANKTIKTMWVNVEGQWRQVDWFFADTLENMNWKLPIEPIKKGRKLVAIEEDGTQREIQLLFTDTKEPYVKK